MTRCAVCQRAMAGGYRAGADRFCSLPCYTHSPTGFCKACLASTSNDAPGGTFTFNSIGTKLFFANDRCPECHSIVQRKAICALFIPLIPLGTYRVIYVGPSRYVGRKVVRHSVAQPMSIEPR